MELAIHNKYSTLVKIAIITLVFLGLSFFYLGIALVLPYNSDHAIILLEAKSIIAGNILLKGWTLSTVSYYTTEIPFTILGILIFGYSEKVVYIVTAVTYALMTLVLLSLCSVGPHGKISIQKAVISFCFSLFIAYLFSKWGYFSPVHIVGFTYCLGSIFCLRGSGDRIGYKALLVWGVLLFLAFLGDSFTIYIWGIPVILLMIFKWLVDKDKTKYKQLLFMTLMAIFLAKILAEILTTFGGFTLPGIKLSLVSLSHFGQNLSLFFTGILDLFSIDFSGHPVFSIDSLVSLMHLFGLAIFVIAIVWSLLHFKKQSMLNQILILSILLNFAEYLFGNVAVNRRTVRYLMPSLIFSVILITSLIAESELFRNKPRYVLAFFLLIGLSLIPSMSLSLPVLPVSTLSTFLAEHHLQNGYGPYWAASITTVHSRGEVTISPVISADGKYIEPYRWLSNDSWYKSNANFLVVDSTQSFDISVETAIATFGEPNETYQVDDYSVLVWNKDISPDLFTKH